MLDWVAIIFCGKKSKFYNISKQHSIKSPFHERVSYNIGTVSPYKSFPPPRLRYRYIGTKHLLNLYENFSTFKRNLV